MTDIIKIAKNIAQNLRDEVTKLGFIGQRILLVSDSNIYDNAAHFFGEDLLQLCHNSLILKDPKADEHHLELVKNAAQDCDVIMALGSGTIGDLCKLTSAQCDVPYFIFASAPSMNGYLSQNASIVIDGHKKSVPACLPVAVFCDMDILANAPSFLIKAGIGDSLCFYSCWFDWYLSHYIVGTDFDESLFLTMQEDMDYLIDHYEQFALHDEKLLALLIRILLISGQMMTKAGGSYPASQSEHLVAHVLEMKYGQRMASILHGAQIAVTTLSCVKRQEALLKQDKVRCDDRQDWRQVLVDYFGENVAKQCVVEFEKKRALVHDFARWDECREMLSGIIVSYERLQRIFVHFGVGVSCVDLGISQEEYEEAMGLACFIRDRFTCLDLV